MENNIKGDYANAGGLVIYHTDCIEDNDPDSGWIDWCFDDYLESDDTDPVDIILYGSCCNIDDVIEIMFGKNK